MEFAQVSQNCTLYGLLIHAGQNVEFKDENSEKCKFKHLISDIDTGQTPHSKEDEIKKNVWRVNSPEQPRDGR